MPHKIRLREPWSTSFCAQTQELTYARRFHRPTNVDGQTLWLRVGLGRGHGTAEEIKPTVLLNGQRLTPSEHEEGGLRFRLDTIGLYNSIEIRIHYHLENDGKLPIFGTFLVESVELEIE